MTEIGKAITSAFAFVAKAGEECDALANLIKIEISSLFHGSPIGDVYNTGEWSGSYKDNGWVYTDVAWSLPLIPKGEYEPVAHLAFQMSFLCDDAAGGWSSEPLLYVNCWADPTDLRIGNYMGFAMEGISPGSISRLKEGTAKLFRWEGGNGASDQWTFGIQLADLNGLEDIRNILCGAIKRLLADIDTGESALDQFEVVLTYSAVDEMPDYYRVVR
jgi:hypothetical protein